MMASLLKVSKHSSKKKNFKETGSLGYEETLASC